MSSVIFLTSNDQNFKKKNTQKAMTLISGTRRSYNMHIIGINVIYTYNCPRLD